MEDFRLKKDIHQHAQLFWNEAENQCQTGYLIHVDKMVKKKELHSVSRGKSLSSVAFVVAILILSVGLFYFLRSSSAVVRISHSELVEQNWTVPCTTKKEFFKGELVHVHQKLTFSACGSKECSRFIWDSAVAEEKELDALISLATNGMSLGGAAGGV